METVLAGRYRLIRQIGGHGSVRAFDAVDTETGAAVTVKMMTADGDEDIESLLRLQQEGAIISTLHHPNLFQVYRSFMEARTAVMVLEPIAGRPLSEILEQERLSLQRAKRLSLQVAAALVYAHARQIIHRDINPFNLVVLDGDRLKIRAARELGAARVMRLGTVPSVSQVIFGLPTYLAPEQIEGKVVDGRADVYSLGAVMYHMVTGRPPFDGTDALTIAARLVHEEPTAPRALAPEVPGDWEALILKAMARRPSHRFPSMKELQAAIESLSVPAAGPGQSVERLEAAGGETRRRCPRCGQEGPGKFCTQCGARLTAS